MLTEIPPRTQEPRTGEPPALDFRQGGPSNQEAFRAFPRASKPRPLEPFHLPPSGVIPWVRILVGAAVLALTASAARAAGCQAEERPAIGLTYHNGGVDHFDGVARLDRLAVRTPRVVPLPCPGQTPASLALDPPSPPALSAAVERVATPSVRSLATTRPPLFHSDPGHAQLERPPRVDAA
jgi:hypothetical protein